MLEMKRFEGRERVRELAIFAAAAGAIPGQAPQLISLCVR
jgi:hypothetical protein